MFLRNVTRHAAALAAVTFAALASPALAEDPATFRVFASRGGIEPHLLAEKLGYYDGTPVRLEHIGYSSGGPESLMAVAGGSGDVGSAATAAVLNSIAAGNDFVLAYPSNGINENSQSHFYVLENSPIKAIADLKGKTIAVNTLGAHLDYTVREALAQNGLKPSDVNLVVVPGPQLEQVLRAGQVDVSAVGYWQTTFDGKLLATGGVREVFNDTDVLGNIAGGFIVLSKKFTQEHPEATRAFVDGAIRAADWSREHPEEAKKVFAEILEARSEPGELAQYWRGFGLRPGAVAEKHDLSFWIERLEAEGSVPKGKLDADALLAASPAAAAKS
ncbi:ABC transporter substrate-binding protein [Paracoccus aminophilus]|uniref:ABC-type nitrate/sulfonate/bicarbonate transport systems, periplasmic component n=1 Tax=Paracoccus aminophilus JCM 7686 TaxID=1367847 RepID=S5Y0Y4_PARAH|nr:ABC transporter substrate-binding protein [Paracoccus aminophilus]AGT11157.1 ABC-type nitrate/sulfonate/bicarbonate transport systems, periplasmic component [Paracoccus aminophilus JCM 7686]